MLFFLLPLFLLIPSTFPVEIWQSCHASYTGSVCHYGSSHFYQLLNLALLSLPYPIKHNLFSFVLINLGSNLPELLFQ